jgi:D-ribose pyranase
VPAVTYVSHDQLKAAVRDAAFVVRTGETTSYANTILTCGVPF